ncbi:MAG: pantoate--beta-alanine ligase [Leptospiraceae bacterium]|nr:pantoate--beta-alanine ligase [Leptospiraceae bacterium]
MLVINKVKEIQEKIFELKKNKKSIGFVPTMGYLHEGHVSLIKSSCSDNEISVVSLFVNPAQFNDPSDFEKYPKNTEKDLEICKENNVDIVFLPEVSEFYPDGFEGKIDIKIPHLMKNLCATTRPGHFEGVMLVISRLFHFVSPDKAYFGKKDYQQFLIIKEFSEIMGFPVEVIGVDTIREEDGLAMSSRNARLSEKGREASNLIFRSMKIAKEYSFKKNVNIKELKDVIREVILSSSLTKIDYLEILDPKDLNEKEELSGDIFIGLAVFVEGVRLIDNFIYRV